MLLICTFLLVVLFLLFAYRLLVAYFLFFVTGLLAYLLHLVCCSYFFNSQNKFELVCAPYIISNSKDILPGQLAKRGSPYHTARLW